MGYLKRREYGEPANYVSNSPANSRLDQEPVPAKTTPMVRRMILISSQTLQFSM